ncbi:TadE family protein [Thiohalomonas denitrificans]|uniref:TadE family protein n=1 Tax=Thiohalomonas denitrificans TaxID=415747 RepID=UPI0026E99955|nr:TadE family protein [Thiohalomonas denitrificans]
MWQKGMRQKGISTVEFALIGLLFFTLLFGIIEAGRAFFAWNTIEEATRRAARIAAVCPFDHSSVRRAAIFEAADGGTESRVLQGMNTGHVTVEYLDDTGAATLSYLDAAFVRVAITGYSYQLFFPFSTFTLPDSSTTVPVESLGYMPELNLRACFGTFG